MSVRRVASGVCFMRLFSSCEKFSLGVGKGTARARRACVVYGRGKKVVAKARPFILFSHASSVGSGTSDAVALQSVLKFALPMLTVGTEWLIEASGCDAGALRDAGRLRQGFGRAGAE